MSNLLEKASIILTPTAYSDGDLHCIKPNTATGDFDFTRSTTATRENSSGNIESVAANLPRIDYLGGTGHILLEPQSTNVTTNSEQPSTWHSSNGVTITADATTSPDGTTNASLVVINTSSGSRYARARLPFSSGSGTQTVTASCFLKYYNNQFIRLKSAFFVGSPAQNESSFFDIQNGVLGTVSSNHTAKIEDYGSGWYRCSITFDIDKDTDNSGYLTVEFPPSDGASGNAEIGQGVYAFGSQGEELSFMTSYIPTSASAVTRSADEANNAGSSDLINSTEGVLYVEIASLTEIPGLKQFSLSDGTNNNHIKFSFRSTENQIQATVKDSGTTTANLTQSNAATTINFFKVAIKYKLNDVALWVNGTEVLTDTSATIPSGLNTLNFDRGDGGNDFVGKVKCVAVFKEALTDAQLQSLTS